MKEQSQPKRLLLADSPFMQFQKEVQQHPEMRRGLIETMEKHFSAKVITYFASFKRRESDVSDDDAESFESLLAAEHQKGEKLLMVINSPGGSALAAERIANVCRAYSDDQFEVLVPHMAKSAATLICFGASTIHMSKTAELGPVDPQVQYKSSDEDEGSWISAEEYVRSYEKLLESASSGKAKRIEPYLQQLGRYDSRFIEKLRSIQELSRDISVRLLKSSMMKKRSEDQIKKAIEIFLAQPKKSVHGRMINYAEATSCGLKTKLVDIGSEIWNTVWELFVRSDWVVDRYVKLMESRESSLYYGAMA